MDEYFHVRQTLQYVKTHDFISWDPKITTPPGLYIVGYIAAKLVGPSLAVLRSVNLTSLLVTILWPRSQSDSRAGQSLLVCGFPLLAFYGALYYTDVLSTLLVLEGMSTKSSYTSALLFLASLWFRQTNIVWTGAAAALRVIGPVMTANDVFSNFTSSFQQLLRKGLLHGPPYAIILVFFVVFLKWNSGIALGDKSNHGVSLHFAQALYFLLFFMFFSVPTLVLSVYKGGQRRVVEIFGHFKWIPIEVATIYAVIKYGTVVHPFILSDNSHYTFYIWRRLITPFGGMMIVPVYWASWRWFLATVNMKVLKTWVLIAAGLAVLVPSPLMEPRYYIVPYLVWRLALYGEPASNLELAWYAAVNCATTYIFCFSKTHFMW